MVDGRRPPRCRTFEVQGSIRNHSEVPLKPICVVSFNTGRARVKDLPLVPAGGKREIVGVATLKKPLVGDDYDFSLGCR